MAAALSDKQMSTFILLLLVGAICSFAFLVIVGSSSRSIPFYLLAGVGGALVGFVLATLLSWNWLLVGGLPVFMTTFGALVFLLLARLIRFE